MKIPCPDENLPAGLTQRDIDIACGWIDPRAADRHERELERADRERDEELDRRAEQEIK